MQETAIDAYVATFVARCNPEASPLLGITGLHGTVPSREDPLTRLLVTDDCAYEDLARVLPSAVAGTISVFTTAERCARLVADRSAWKPTMTQTMICRDLHTVPQRVLPSELTLRRVRRLTADEPAQLHYKTR